MMRGQKTLFSRNSDDWTTPKDLFDKLDREFKFTDDPCPAGGTDGLERRWGGRNFVNPPYSNIRAFLEKALKELREGRAKVCVFLLPARTDTKWFHEIVQPYHDGLRFIKGRLKFGNSKNSAPFPSMIVVFKRR